MNYGLALNELLTTSIRIRRESMDPDAYVELAGGDNMHEFLCFRQGALRIPYTPSQLDQLANDWVVMPIEPEAP